MREVKTVQLRALIRKGSKEEIVTRSFVPVLVRNRSEGLESWHGSRYVPVETFMDSKRNQLRAYSLETEFWGRTVPPRVNMTKRYRDCARTQLIVVNRFITRDDIYKALEESEKEPEVARLKEQEKALLKQIDKLDDQRHEVWRKYVDLKTQTALAKLGMMLE